MRLFKKKTQDDSVNDESAKRDKEYNNFVLGAEKRIWELENPQLYGLTDKISYDTYGCDDEKQIKHGSVIGVEVVDMNRSSISGWSVIDYLGYSTATNEDKYEAKSFKRKYKVFTDDGEEKSLNEGSIRRFV